MLFSKSTEYSIKILIYLSKQKNETYLSAKNIAASLHLPHQFVAKILQSLTHIGIIISQKGKGGGFILSQTASEIRLSQLINLFEKDSYSTTCILGLNKSCELNYCNIHKHWMFLKEEIENCKIDDLNQV